MLRLAKHETRFCARSGASRKGLPMWKRHYGRNVCGIKIEGDKTVRPTTIWNILYMKYWGWKTVVVFVIRPEDAERGYRLGFRAYDGSCMVNSAVYHDEQIAMRVGHEDCTFLVLRPDDTELVIGSHHRSTKAGIKKLGIRLV